MSRTDKHQQRLEQQLSPGEVVIATITATATERGAKSGPTRGALVLTNIRIVYSGSGGFSQALRDIPLGQVASLNLSRGAMLAHIEIGVAGVAERFLVKYNEAAPWLEAAQQALSTYRTWLADQARPATTQGTSTTPSLADELAKLASLHSQGLLTEQEYSAAKSRLLGG